MIRFIRKIDAGTVLAHGLRYDADRVRTAMLDVLRALVSAAVKADPKADPVFRLKGHDKTWWLNAAGYASITSFFRGQKERWDCDDQWCEVLAGSYRIRLHPLGDHAHLSHGVLKSITGQPLTEDDIVPHLFVYKVGKVADFLLAPDQQILVTEVFTGFLPTGVAFTRSPDGTVGATGTLTFPHAAFGAGEGEIRISATDF